MQVKPLIGDVCLPLRWTGENAATAEWVSDPVTQSPWVSPALLESILFPGAGRKTWEGNTAGPLAPGRRHGDSPQRGRRQRTQRPESERGWVGRNMQGGYPFSKMQVWKDLLSCWARALMTVSPLPTPRHCLLIWELPNSSEKNFFTSLVFLPVLLGRWWGRVAPRWHRIHPHHSSWGS